MIKLSNTRIVLCYPNTERVYIKNESTGYFRKTDYSLFHYSLGIIHEQNMTEILPTIGRNWKKVALNALLVSNY